MSFRALTDTIKHQGQALREIERTLSTKVSTKDFHTILSQKLDFADFSENFAFLKSELETKASHFELESIISKTISDTNYNLSSKATIEQLRNLSKEKLSCDEFSLTVNDLYGKLNFFHDEINRMLQTFSSHQDLGDFRSENSSKFEGIFNNIKNLEEIQANLLAKKLNRSDFDTIIARKNDEIKALHLAVEVKAEAE